MDRSRILVYSHDDSPLFEIAPSEISGRVRREVVNGEHTLTLTTTRLLEKEMRVLTVDGTGKWREYVVQGEASTHAKRAVDHVYKMHWSLQHDLGGVICTKMPGAHSPVSAQAALTSLLSETARWNVGTVTRMTYGGASMYEKSCWEALKILVGEWGGEVDASIQVSTNGVVSRSVDLWDRQGSQNATRRFDWNRDITEITRDVSSDPVYCRIIPKGKGEETEAGGYGRKITIESVNDGLDYLQNDDTAPLLRLPTSSGWEYPSVIVTNGNIDSPAKLKEWGESVLDEYTVPKVTYSASVLQFSQAGLDYLGVALGDAVQCVDKGFSDEGLRIVGRVREMTVNELRDNDISLVIGDARNGLESLLAQVSAIADAVKAINGGSLSTYDYLQNLLSRLNGEINATGGYFYITEGQGARTYDRAVEDPLVGSEASAVTEIKGGTIRIANSKTSAGDWDWQTVFVSGHIAAALVTTANIVAGYIGSADSGNYFNFDTGESRIMASAMVVDKDGNETALGEYIKDVDVEYAQNQSRTEAPETGWSSIAPAWQSGYYIWQRTKTTSGLGTEYSDPTCISGADGASTTVTKVEYGTSASASVQPSSWSTTAPTSIAKGVWLWTKTTFSDSHEAVSKSYVGTDGDDGKSVYVQSVTKVGGITTVVLSDGTESSTLTINDGEDGDDGRAGANGYVHVAWATSADGSEGFSTSVSAGKTYIGVYSDDVQADSQTYTDYSWSLIKGDTGIGVKAVVEQYYLSTSSTTQTGGSWSTAQPAWSSGKYIWTRSAITWTDDTTTYTTPVLAKAINGANKAVSDLDTSLNQQEVFNRLTNNGTVQGITLSGGQLYINASYINSGTISANKISGGTMSVGSLFIANLSSGTVTIGGFTVTASSIYSGKSQADTTTAGIYIGHTAVSVGNGSQYVALGYGGVYGGANSTTDKYRYAGYMTFGESNAFSSTSTGYGIRIAGRAGILFLTNGSLYITSNYYTYNTSVTSSQNDLYKGASGKVTIKLPDGSESTIWFWRGLMVTALNQGWD